MRKYAERLTQATHDLTVGNHAVHFIQPRPNMYYTSTYRDDKDSSLHTVERSSREFLYHNNVICVVDDLDGKYWLSHAGWFTTSTSQALGQYKAYFSGLGYKCMTE